MLHVAEMNICDDDGGDDETGRLIVNFGQVIVLLRHFKQTQDFTSFPRQAIIAHLCKLNSYFRALQYRNLLGADY